MKKLLLLTLIMFSILTVSAQKPLKYQEVLPFEGTSKAELMTRTKAFIAQKFTANSTKYTEDTEGGMYVIQDKIDYVYQRKVSPMSYMYKASGNISYVITIEIKDNKVRLSFSDFIHQGANNLFHSFGLLTDANPPEDAKKWMALTWNDSKDRTREEFVILRDFFIKYINEYDSEW